VDGNVMTISKATATSY